MLNKIISLSLSLMMTSIINTSKTQSEAYKILRLHHQQFYKKKTSAWSKGKILNNMQTIEQAKRVDSLCKRKHEMALLSEVVEHGIKKMDSPEPGGLGLTPGCTHWLPV